MKQRLSPFRIIAAGALWRLVGSRRSGEKLITAMSSDDEQVRMLAGMSLIKAGHRSFDLIVQRVEAGEASAPLIRLLPDIGGESARDVLESIAAGDQSKLKETARECVDLLDRIDSLAPEDY